MMKIHSSTLFLTLSDDKENPQRVWNAAADHHDDSRRVTV
mgnify:CR=1 FL=1